ncbi:MAG: FAD-dependent oxidoreductase [Deltaproteobacteria bacterium]|nr:FAD-dependent oxidoreductase [Deltaproteobacteria bacterium]
MTQKHPSTLKKIQNYGPDVRNFSFEFEAGKRFDFEPGQFVMVEVADKEGKVKKKPYSIASPPYLKDTIELCIKKVEGGLVSNWFFTLQEGALVEFLGPKGAFQLKRPLAEHLIFVATGTGIAPLRSQFLQLLHEGHSGKISLVFGNRYEDQIPFHQDLLDLAKQYPNFEYLPILSRPKNWSGPQGYVQDLIKTHFADPSGKTVYICGLVPMVNDLKACLESLGYKKEAILFEKWT